MNWILLAGLPRLTGPTFQPYFRSLAGLLGVRQTVWKKKCISDKEINGVQPKKWRGQNCIHFCDFVSFCCVVLKSSVNREARCHRKRRVQRAGMSGLPFWVLWPHLVWWWTEPRQSLLAVNLYNNLNKRGHTDEYVLQRKGTSRGILFGGEHYALVSDDETWSWDANGG